MRRTFPGEAHSAMQFYRSSRQSRIIHWFGAILSVLVLLFPAAGVAQQPHQELLSQADQILKEMSR
ncbi:MAG TPA: hypothetical protein VMO17_10705, partial [Terriglobia bacterium]|nr:hypothetical protein [Terriglobia bacterium]